MVSIYSWSTAAEMLIAILSAETIKLSTVIAPCGFRLLL
jgi:hypothetical protein